MSNAYRFRVDEGKLVLQVLIPKAHLGYYDREPEWRDADSCGHSGCGPVS